MDFIAIAIAAGIGLVAGFFIGRSTAPKPRSGTAPGSRPTHGDLP